MHEVTVIRPGADTPDTPAPTPLSPTRWKWRTVRAYPKQSDRERLRRMRQITRRQLSGPLVSDQADQIARHVRLVIAACEAEAACHEYVNEAIVNGEEDRLPGRDALFIAVSDLARWLRGEASTALKGSATATAASRAHIVRDQHPMP